MQQQLELKGSDITLCAVMLEIAAIAKVIHHFESDIPLLLGSQNGYDTYE